MFDNVGGKLKKVAQVVCFAGMVMYTVVGILLIVRESVGYGLLAIVFGCLVSWIGSLCLYGFAEIIINVKIIAKNTKSNNKSVDKYAVNKKIVKDVLKDESIEDDELIDFKCPDCGATVSYSKEDLHETSNLNCPECQNNIVGKTDIQV